MFETHECKGQLGFSASWPMVVSLFLLAMAPLLMAPVLPLIDFYNHLARFFILAHIDSNAFLQSQYSAHWVLLPNIGVDLIGVPLLNLLPPLVAGHCIIIFILALQYTGALYFHRALIGRNSVLIALLLLPLLYSYVLNWGFANYLMGQGLAFLAAGWWISFRDRPRLAVPVSCVLALLVFLSHGLALVLYGLLVILVELGFSLQCAPWRIGALVRRLGLLAIQAVAPVMIFLVWQQASSGGTVPLTSKVTESFVPRVIGGFSRHLNAILHVSEGPALWFDVVTLVITIAGIGMLMWSRRLSVARPARVMAFIALLLALVPIPTLFSVGHIADRMPLFAAMVVISSLSIRPDPWSGWERFVVFVLALTVFARLGAVAWDWHGYDKTYREYVTIAERIPPGHIVAQVMVGLGHHETVVPRTEMYGPLLVPLRGAAVPLFSDERQQPMLLNGRLKRATGHLPSQPIVEDRGIMRDYNHYLLDAASAGFDYLLVSNAQLLTRPLPDGLDLVARTPHFLLLRPAAMR